MQMHHSPVGFLYVPDTAPPPAAPNPMAALPMLPLAPVLLQPSMGEYR